MDLTKQARRTLWICAALSTVSLGVFWPVTGCDFINYDDPAYVTVNLHVMNGFNWKGVAWAFQPGFAGNWHPLTWFSHMLDAQLFGLKAGWHHFVSLLLHVANTVLLFLLCQRLTGAPWRSATVAALFALHPLHVESVAWISERKDVLSAFLFMLTLWAYVRYAQAQRLRSEVQSQESDISNQCSVVSDDQATDHGPRTTRRASGIAPSSSIFYLLSLCFFALGLMSKPMLVTLPFVLLLLDYWPLGRLQVKPQEPRLKTCYGLLREKVPFLILSALSCVITFQAQSLGGAVRPLALLSLEQRLSNAVVGYATYLKQTIWPAGLAVFYPLSNEISLTITLGAGVLLLGITAWAITPLLAGTRCTQSQESSPGSGTRWNASLARQRRPWRAVGWFWFLGMLVPVIGLVQVGMQQTADRYTYLPLVGLFVMVVWELADWLGSMAGRAGPCAPFPGIETSEFGASWQTGGALGPARPASAGKVACGIAAGLVLAACAAITWKQAGYWQDSERLFRHALSVTRNNWLAHHSLGHALLAQGKQDEAIVEYQAAAALEPRPEIRFILGETLSQRHRYDEAVAQFTELLKVSPNKVAALVQIGIARALQGKTEEAVEALSAALQIDPADSGAHNSLGNILAQQGRHEEAVREFEEAVRLKPDHAGALNNLAISCRKLGRMDEAIAHYRAALRLEPDSLQALNNLAWTLATCPDARFRNGAEAVQLATQACEVARYQNPIPLVSLAAAYGEVGRFGEAVSFAEQALALTAESNSPLNMRLQTILQALRTGQPYHGE